MTERLAINEGMETATEQAQEPGKAQEPAASRQPAEGWHRELWLWPPLVILMVTLAGGLFGAYGALIVGGQVLGVVSFIAATRLLGSRYWTAVGLAVIIASTTGLVGLAQAHFTHTPGLSGKAQTTPKPKPVGILVDLHGQRIDANKVRDTNFQGANLSGANLDGLDLRGKRFDGANAYGASFRGSRLGGASLRGTNLQQACLRGADFTGADLSGADASGADTQGANPPANVARMVVGWSTDNAARSIGCS